MDFSKALRSTVHYLFLKSLTPTFIHALSEKIYIPWLSPALRNTTFAFESLRNHMLEIVSDARAVRNAGSKAYIASHGTARSREIIPGLLTNLVGANMAFGEDNLAEKSKTLTDGELLSNTFVRTKPLHLKVSIINSLFSDFLTRRTGYVVDI
jgi:hypothetical protein